MQKEFKAESKRLLELMVNSIYTNKEIFLRELISNASDATDKRYYNTLQAGGEALNRSDLPIEIRLDKDKRTLTIEDHGVGMTEQELELNLGTIAHSGSLDFKQELAEQDDIDIIGQFGVGFYSAFMVSDTVEVYTKTEESKGLLWESDGIEGYTIAPTDKKELGTKIVLHLKKDTEDEQYDKYLEEYQVKSLITKHSDYIRYPIRMELDKSRKIEDSEEFETYREVETLNSMTPIWKKRKQDVTKEEYYDFYRDKFDDYQDPLHYMQSSSEGLVSYQGLLFIPGSSPMNYYTSDYEKGLQLYASGVLIMEKCGDLLPDHFGFVKGLVDSQDLSLNISREMLQQDRQLQIIANHLEKRIQTELENMLKNDREAYEKFFANFGMSLKIGVQENFGANKDKLQDLLLYHSSTGDGMTTFAEYVSRMPEAQEFIYYAVGDNLAHVKKQPAAERVLDAGYEILYMTDPVDEFSTRMIDTYEEKKLRSLAEADLGLETEEEKEALEEKAKDHETLFDTMKELLGGKVEGVRLSTRLKSQPVCMGTQGEITFEMEKMFANMPNGPGIKAERVLELNPNHPMLEKLKKLQQEDPDKLKQYTEILLGQALLLEGLELEDPQAFTGAVSDLML